MTLGACAGSSSSIIGSDAQHSVRRKTFDREGTGHADFLLVIVGFVIEVLELRLGGDGGVNFLLRAMRTCHQSACSFFAASGHLESASRGISHSSQVFLIAALNFSAQRL